MKILGILGSHRDDGATAKMLDAVLSGVRAPNETETIFLGDYAFKPDTKERRDPVLDELEEKMLASDIWVLAAPTYWGSLSGEMKNFFDCMRQRLVRFDHEGGAHPDRFKDKHYLSLTNCYAGTFENWVTGMTDQAFRTIDKVMTAAGLIKVRELVLTNTWGLETLPEAKIREFKKWGNRLNTKIKKDDSTMKRYVQLFFMVAIMALLTMGLQVLFKLMPVTNFWLHYASFVAIFYVLLALILHFFTVVKHRRR